MRLWKCQCLLLGALIVNVIILYYFWKLQNSLEKVHHAGDDGSLLGREGLRRPFEGPLRRADDGPNNYLNILSSVASDPSVELAKVVTVVLREFEFFENDLSETVQSFLKVFPSIKLVVIADAYPYPPLQLPANGSNGLISVVVLHPRVDEPPFVSRPERHINTPFVLLVPDSVRVTSTGVLEEMLTYLVTHPNRLVAAKVTGEKARCVTLGPQLREWILLLKEEDHPKSDAACDAILGTSVVLVPTKSLFDLSQPFSRPFPYAFFIQTTLRKWKVHLMDRVVFQQGRPLFLDSHLKWKHSSAVQERLKMLYEDFGIKKVVNPPGGPGDVEWYGCSKTTSRCFGSVLEDMPEYLYANRWTPPCCLKGLRETARHVFKTFKTYGVRYWLEGGSLLGAARNGDIIPWDYDVDIGMYEADVPKCPWLKKILENDPHAPQSVITDDGFVWEKAVEGDFFRVQYSQTNHLHVDIFPFYPKEGGIMTKRTWIKGHRQDMEFPEHYLRPLTTLRFLDMDASAPNNIREFLELKFGEGVIENPQYPNPKLIGFPNGSRSHL